jgi:Protein of unknown function (DUF3054)
VPRALQILLDLAVVLAFAVIGRASHAEALDPSQLGRTAAPFLAATLMAWVLMVMRPGLVTGWRQAALVWGTTLVLGMLFRAMLGQGVQPSFVAVAGAVLLAGMAGWRALAHVALRARRGDR